MNALLDMFTKDHAMRKEIGRKFARAAIPMPFDDVSALWADWRATKEDYEASRPKGTIRAKVNIPNEWKVTVAE